MSPTRIAVIVLGLTAALALAVLGAHPRVKELERRLGVTVLISAGIPFLFIGMVFGMESVGILTPDVLRDLKPAFEFGLGWIGFHVGMQFDVRRMDALPRRLGSVIAVESVVPMATTAVLGLAAFVAVDDLLWDPWFVRDALILAACAAPSAPVSVPYLSRVLGARPAGFIGEVTIVDEVVCLAMLGVVAVIFRPQAGPVLWVLPASAWLLVSLGLGGVLGIATYVVVRGAHSASEELALLLGAVALSAGMAGYLSLSVPVVCAIAGALLANLPLRDADGLKRILDDVERPVYLVFLLIVGASWRPGEWQGWIVAPCFVFARVIGKHIGAVLARRVGPPDLPAARDMSIALMPQSPISVVAIVAAGTLYQTSGQDRIRWALNAVIIGGVLTEVVVRTIQRLDPRLRARPLVVLDEPAPPGTGAGGGGAP